MTTLSHLLGYHLKFTGNKMLGRTHKEVNGIHTITVSENHKNGAAGYWNPLKSFENENRDFADWEASVFAFEEASNMRIHTDGKEAVYAELAERGRFPPEGY